MGLRREGSHPDRGRGALADVDRDRGATSQGGVRVGNSCAKDVRPFAESRDVRVGGWWIGLHWRRVDRVPALGGLSFELRGSVQRLGEQAHRLRLGENCWPVWVTCQERQDLRLVDKDLLRERKGRRWLVIGGAAESSSHVPSAD